MSPPATSSVGKLLFLVVLAWPAAASAERPAGSYGAVIGAPNEIFRLARVEPDLVDEIGCGALSSGINGKYRTRCNLEQITKRKRIRLKGPFTIKTYNKNGKTRLALKSSLKGDAEVRGDSFDAKAALKGKDQVTPGIDFVDTDYRFKLCLKGGGDSICDSGRFPTTIPLATGNGEWELILKIDSPGGAALTGTATLMFADGMMHEYKLKGTYDANDDRSRIEFKATDPKRGGSLLLKKATASAGGQLTGTLVYDLYGHSDKTVRVFDEPID